MQVADFWKNVLILLNNYSNFLSLKVAKYLKLTLLTIFAKMDAWSAMDVWSALITPLWQLMKRFPIYE